MHSRQETVCSVKLTQPVKYELVASLRFILSNIVMTANRINAEQARRLFYELILNVALNAGLTSEPLSSDSNARARVDRLCRVCPLVSLTCPFKPDSFQDVSPVASHVAMYVCSRPHVHLNDKTDVWQLVT